MARRMKVILSCTVFGGFQMDLDDHEFTNEEIIHLVLAELLVKLRMLHLQELENKLLAMTPLYHIHEPPRNGELYVCSHCPDSVMTDAH